MHLNMDPQIKEILDDLLEFRRERDWEQFHSPKNLSMALSVEASELLARVIQHEYDHLQGVLFIDRIPDEDNKKLKKELNKIKRRKRDFDYPVTEHMDYQLL